MGKSTRSAGTDKPAKPRPDFPLFPHASDRWAKKIRGKLHYFGKVSTDTQGEAALALWLEQKDALLAGRTPKKRSADGLTVADLCNRFLTAKESLKEAGEITPRSFADYFKTCKRIVDWFGKSRIVDPEELDTTEFGKFRANLAKARGPVALGNEIIRIRMVFKFADDEGLIPRPIRFGQSFSKPSSKVYLQAEAEGGPKMFEAEELRRILEAVSVDRPDLHAIVMLAINAGFGQNDIAMIPTSAFDLNGGWVKFPRPKTGVNRRAKLWPETIAALRIAFASRPAPKDPQHGTLAFLTPRGEPWIRDFEESQDPDDPKSWKLWQARSDSLGKAFKLVLKKLGIGGRRGFYGIRHSFQTAADNNCRDDAAVKHVMGHTDTSMSARYRDRFEDHRLETVAEAVRKWLVSSGS